MKNKSILFAAALAAVLVSAPAFASTTVTVDDNSHVTVGSNQAVQTTTVQTVPVQTVVVQEQPVVLTKTQDPRELEGEIIRVDYPHSLIVVRDIDGRERKITLKQGMINTYKVDDYVKIYLMADMKEAKTISTQHTADIEGDIANVDYTRNQIVVRRTNGTDAVILIKPGMMNNYKAGDRVRLYVVTDYNSLQEAKLIRVR